MVFIKKLKFTLKDSDNVIYDDIFDYTNVDDILNFEINRENLSLKANNNYFYLKKESEESIFEISFFENKITSNIILKNIDNILELPIELIEYSYLDKIITIKYIVSDDQNNIKNISIELLN